MAKKRNKEAQSRYSKNHYQKNRSAVIDRAKRFKPIALRRNREFVWNYLMSHPCIDCGEKDPIVLEFDHRADDKVTDVSTMAKNCCSLKRIKEEITKCDVRCANCHRRKTAIQFSWFVGNY